MAKRTYVAAAALAAGILTGGAAGLVLGIPGVSNAQTTTVPGQAPGAQGDQGTPGTPGDRQCDHEGQAPGDRAPGDRAPQSGPGAATNTGFRFR